ncbi:hypothetical protein KY349_02090 [Candidatus Woesearchaeota archaeon]|nr:hypothetical protein [Candidatus Woesearchaeota archaeon]
MKKEYLKLEWETFKQSFKVDRRFWFILLWEVLLIIAVVLGFMLFSLLMSRLEPLLMSAMSAASSFTLEQAMFAPTDAQLQSLQTKMIWYTVTLFIYLLLIWPLFKSLTYLTLLKKRLTAKFYGKFLAASILWTVFIGIILYIIQLIFYKTLFNALPYSAAARATVLIGLIVLFVLTVYFTLMFFIMFTRVERLWLGIKQFLNLPVKKIRHFLVPMLYALLVFLALNILMKVFQTVPALGTLLSTVVVIAYIAWLKIYYNDCIENAIQRLAPKKPKKAKKPKKTTKKPKKQKTRTKVKKR